MRQLNALMLLICLAFSGCAVVQPASPVEKMNRMEAHIMHLCGMGILVNEDNSVTTQIHQTLINNPKLSAERREGVQKAYDLCHKNLKRGYDRNPENIPEGFPSYERAGSNNE